MADISLAQQVLEAARGLTTKNLSCGASGNVSARSEAGMLITPTGMTYDQLAEGDLVSMSLDGKAPEGQRKPSSEWHFHGAIYAHRPEVGAIVHCHSSYATAVSCTGRPIPPFHYMVAVAGGRDIPLADYATFGTGVLADHVVRALDGRRACLLAHHGQIALGDSPASALALAEEVEELAKQFTLAMSIGDVRVLSDYEMKRVLDKFSRYGQQD